LIEIDYFILSIFQLFCMIFLPLLLPLVLVVAPLGFFLCCLVARQKVEVPAEDNVELGRLPASAPPSAENSARPQSEKRPFIFNRPFGLTAAKWVSVGDLAWDQVGTNLTEHYPGEVVAEQTAESEGKDNEETY
jgi:hypothetical protein